MSSKASCSAYRDIAGGSISVGSFVCYAALWGRCATLRYGLVTDLTTRHDGFRGEDKPVIRVIGVDRSFEGEWHVLKKGQQLTLAFFARLLVVPAELVPAAALQLLRQTQLDGLVVTDG